MSQDPSEVLSALLDGEDVEPEELRAAMARPGAGELLRDLALLRAKIRADTAEPSEAFRRRMRAALRERSLEEPRRLRWLRVAVPMAAAALVVLALYLWIGGRYEGTRGRAADRPPKPDQVLRFEPGTEWISDRKGSS
jgi:hypothetical protein